MSVGLRETLRGYLANYLIVKLIFSFLLSFPLAGLLKRIPDSKPAYKNIFIIGCGHRYWMCDLTDSLQSLHVLFGWAL